MLTDLDYDLLSAYIDDALSESERTALELRLQSEPELRSELDELRATVTLLNNLPVLKAPRDFTLDARYVRRTSFFFTSAAFSAFASAAAIILFALGAYLFIGNGNAAAPSTSSSQEGQLTFRATSTTATMDKVALSTATSAVMQNQIALTATPLNSPAVPGDLTANDALALPTSTVLPSVLPAQPPLAQADTAQSSDGFSPTVLPTSGFLAGSQQRTGEATETLTDQSYAAAPSSDGAVGAAAPSPMEETESTGGEANASSAFAATQPLFTATLTPSLTITASPTLTLSPTLTSSPTVTASPTLTPSATLIETATPAPTSARQAAQPPESAVDDLPLILVVLGVIFLLVAVITTLIRRRSRS